MNLSTLVVLAFCFITGSTLHSADLFDLYYEIQDGVVTITGCDSSAEGSLVIPEQIEGKPVKKIEPSAFQSSNISEITLPNTLEKIENETFALSPHLRKINIGNGVIRIGRAAFRFCQQLEEITFSKNLQRIDQDAFEFNKSLKEIVLPESLVSLGSGVFRQCTLLESVEISGKLDAIPRDTFGGCGRLKNITLPDSIKSIGQAAFNHCQSLEDIVIPVNVTSIYDRAFWSCTSLKNISLPDTLKTIGETAFAECKNLENVTIPGGITTFGNGAFQGCYDLKSVKILNGLTYIGGEAFSGCSSLESIILPNSITSIEYRAFQGCESLKSIQLPENLVTIEGGLFSGCESLEEIKLPKSITAIGGSAFALCKSLKMIDLPDKITLIGPSTFAACELLEEIKLPSDLEVIGSRAFQGCSDLRSITIPVKVTKLNKNVFKNTGSLRVINFLPMEMPTIASGFSKDVRPDVIISIPIGSTLYEPLIGQFYVTNISEKIGDRSELSINSIKFKDTNSQILSINFNSELGKIYIIESSSNLQEWQNVGTVLGESNVTDYQLMSNDAVSRKTFYRISEKDKVNGAEEQIIAFQDFDISNNLKSTRSYEYSSGNDLEPNSFSNPGDGWGVYSRDSGGPFNFFDDSVKPAGNGNLYPQDSQGFVDSSKTDKFWGITDTDNNDLRDGHAGVNFIFDISSAEMITKISMEFAGMGEFDSDDYMYVYFRVDDGPFKKICGTYMGSENLEQTYVMEDGDEFTYSGAMEFYYNGLDGEFESSVLKNKFEEFSTDLFCLDFDLKRSVCKGNELTISVLSRVDGNTPALGFDTLKIYGIMKDDNRDR